MNLYMKTQNKIIISLAIVTVAALVAVNPFEFKNGGIEFHSEGASAATITFTGDEEVTSTNSTSFGERVAIDGVWAVVTEEGQSFAGSGKANFFLKDIESGTWSFNNAVTLDAYQNSGDNRLDVAISGNFAVVGDMMNDSIGADDGKVFVLYKHQGGTNQWGVFQSITKDLGLVSRFGTSVDIDNHLMVVGAMNDDSSGTGNAGGAYVYAYNGSTWVEEEQLYPTVPVVTGYFGWDVAVHEPLVIVGAYNANDAYIFHRRYVQTCPSPPYQWGLISRLTESGAVNFGWSVDIHGGTAVVGAQGSDTVYVYEADQNFSIFSPWTLQQSLTGSDTQSGDLFGESVSMFGETLFVGARSNGTNGTGDGAVYRFERTDDTWTESDVYHDDTSGGVDNLGSGVSINGSDVVAGAEFGEKAFLDTYCTDPNTVPGEPGKYRPACPARVGTNPGAWTEQDFGYDVAIDGSAATGYYAAVSQLNQPRNNPYVTVYYNNPSDSPDQGFMMQAKLKGPVASGFGPSIDLHGDYLAVHAPGDNQACTLGGGSAMIYKRIGEDWSFLTRKYLPYTCSTGSSAKDAIAISDDTMAFVSYCQPLWIFGKDVGGTDNWGFIKNYTTSGNAGAVAVDGDYIVMGNQYQSGFGEAYIYKRNQGGSNNWGLLKTLYSTNPTSNDRFGGQVDMYGDYVIIAADQENLTPERGAAYIFNKDQGGADNWGLQARLTDDTDNSAGFFGSGVAINNDYAVVGDYSAKKAHVFYRNGTDWTTGPLHLESVDGGDDTNDNFGWAVSLSDDYMALEGNYHDDVDDVESNQTTARMEGSVEFIDVRCGNSTLDTGEDCDDGNRTSGDGCNYICALEYCGDNINNNGGTEQCDGEADCDVDCTLITECTLPDNTATEQKVEVSGAQFQNNVALAGNYAFVGDYTGNSTAGSVHVFKKDEVGTWSYLKEIVSSDGIPNDSFGNALDAVGDTLVVTAYGNNSSTGAAYVFYKDQGGADNWGEVKKLIASDGAANDYFGVGEKGVSISGSYIIVGAPYAPLGNGDGGAYIFKKDEGGTDNWGQIKKIPGSVSSYFGFAVAVEGSTAVISEIGDNDFEGSAHIYSASLGGADNWGEVKEIFASDTVPGDTFGFFADLSGDTVAIAAASQGAIYIFDKNEGGADNWGEVAKVAPAELTSSDSFGYRFALEGDILTASAIGFNDGAGAVFTFFRNQGGDNNWGKLQKIEPSDVGTGNFGFGVGMTDTDIVARTQDSMYFYEAPFCPVPTTTTGGGGRGPQGRPVCSDSATFYDLPDRLITDSNSGNPEVHLDWSRNTLTPGLSVDVYRNAQFLATVPYPGTDYVDTTVSPSVCNANVAGSCAVKQVSYYLQTRNACGETAIGASGIAFINPTVPTGTPVHLSADLSLIIKEGFNQLFEDKLGQLEDLSRTSASAGASTLTNLSAEETDLLRLQAEAACTTAKSLYYRSKDTRSNQRLASDYIIKCFGDGLLTPDDVAPLIPPLIQFRLEPADVEILLQEQVQKIIDSKGITTVLKDSLGTIVISGSTTFDTLATDTSDATDATRETILCGGDTINCTSADKSLIESFFVGASHAADVTIELFDSVGAPMGAPVSVHTDIFGRANNIDLGTILSGTDYSIKITLDNQPYVLPKILPINVTNPTPATVNGQLTFVARLPLTFRDQFCFGDFDENEVINLDDMFTLRTLIETVGEAQIFDIWDNINLDGIGSFDLSDMVTLLQNFQCTAQVNEEGLTLQELGNMMGF